jgi:hypothetical protein
MPLTVQKFHAFLRRLTIGSKALITFIATGTSLMQIQQARDFVIKNTVAHPHVASLAGGLLGIMVVLHNPQVQKFLHIEQQTTEDGTVTTSIQTSNPAKDSQ